MCEVGLSTGSYIAFNEQWTGASQPPKASQRSSDSELLWRALVTEFEDASQEVLANLHEHQTQGTQIALDALVRAHHRRSTALTDMLRFLDDGGSTK